MIDETLCLRGSHGMVVTVSYDQRRDTFTMALYRAPKPADRRYGAVRGAKVAFVCGDRGEKPRFREKTDFSEGAVWLGWANFEINERAGKALSKWLEGLSASPPVSAALAAGQHPTSPPCTGGHA